MPRAVSPPSGSPPSGTRSLLLTGLGDVWAALRESAGRKGEGSGLVLMVVSAACFALMAGVAKKLLPDTPTQAIVLSRGVLMTLVFVLLARRQRAPLLGKRPAMLLLRGLLGYAAVSCYFHSVHQLPLGDAVLLQYSHPVFVALLAPLLLGEPFERRDLGLVLAALGGVALIVRPSGEVRPDALIGVTGSVLSGLAYMAVRQLSRSEHPTTILVWFPLATIPLALASTLASGRAWLPRTPLELAGHLLVTATALLGQLTLTHGLARAGAAAATGVTLAGPVFGIAFGFLLFGTVPGPASLLGTAIVLGSVGLLGLSRIRSTSRRSAP